MPSRNIKFDKLTMDSVDKFWLFYHWSLVKLPCLIAGMQSLWSTAIRMIVTSL